MEFQIFDTLCCQAEVETIDIPSLTEIITPANDDLLLIYDVSVSANRSIERGNLVGQTALIDSINDLTLIGGDMIYAASSMAFTNTPSKAFGRTLLNSSSITEAQTSLGLLIGTDVQAYNSILSALSVSAASAVNNDIFYYNSGALSRITLSNYVRDTLLTIASASALATSLNCVTYTTATNNRLTRWSGTSGVLQNTGVSIDDSDNITGVNSLNLVTSFQLSQLQNINSAISSTQWGYLENSNQSFSTTSNVLFNSLQTTTGITAGGSSTFNSTINMASNKILNLANPTDSTDAANKFYVDSVAGSGLTPLEQAIAASVGNVNYTYNNTGGTNSRGSLTAPTNGIISIDGISLTLGQRVLIKDQTTLLQNGVYIVDDIGSIGTPYVLERSTDFYSGVDPIAQNSFLLVTQGDTNAGTGWILTQTVTTVGVNDVIFAQYSSQLSAGNGLEQKGGALNVVTVGTTGNIYVNGDNQVDINGTLAISKGGTNQSSYTANRILAYNSAGTSFETTSISPSSVVTLTDSQNLTNKTLDSSTNTISADAIWDRVGNKVSINNTPSALSQVLKISSLSPNQAQWLTESVDINGLTATTTAENDDEIIIYDTSVSANRKMTRSNFLTGISPVLPAGIIRVATSGGDYTTINAAIAVAVSGSVILVYPGTYPENITIPAGVRIVGYPSAQQVRITGSDTTSSRVTINDTCTLREVTVVGPSSGSNPIIDCSGLNAGELAVIFNVVISGGGAVVDGLYGSGNGNVGILGLYHIGGNLDSLVHVNSGTMTGVTLIGYSGSCNNFVEASETGIFTMQTLQVEDSNLYSCTDMFNISSTSPVEADSVVIPDITGVINGIHVTAESVNISLSSAHFHVTAYSILVDPSLTGENTNITFFGEIERERISTPDSYRENCESFLISGIDKGVDNDTAFIVDGEIAVGSLAQPSKLSVGTGDDVVDNMLVLSFNGVATYVNNTTAAKSRSSSTFSLFQAVTSGNIAYIGNTVYEFNNIHFDINTAMDVGSGSYLLEYWNGSAWTSFNYMVTLVYYPNSQNAQNLFYSTDSEHVRVNIDIEEDWEKISVNSMLAYWIRIRIVSNITTIPVLQRVKLGGSRSRLGENGFTEYFGTSELKRNVPLSTIYRSIGTPADALFDISTNITTLRIPNSTFSNGSYEGFSYIYLVSEGLDTSRDITCTILWTPSNSNTGIVELVLRFVSDITTDTNINAGNLTETSYTETININTASSGVIKNTVFTFSIPDSLPGQILILQLSRDARSSNPNDTYNGDVKIFYTELNTIRWN